MESKNIKKIKERESFEARPSTTAAVEQSSSSLTDEPHDHEHFQASRKKNSTQSPLPTLADSQISSFFKPAKQRERSNLRKKSPLTSKPKSKEKRKITDNVLSFSSSDPSGVFSNLRILFIQNSIDNIRLELMKSRVKDKGGDVVDVFDSSVTHIITALPEENVHDALGLDDKNLRGVLILQPDWISVSIKDNKLADVDIYQAEKSAQNPQDYQSPMIGTKRTRKNPIGDDSEINRFKKRALSPERDRSLSPTDDPLLDVIQEAKHLIEKGVDLDEENEEENKETSQSNEAVAGPSTIHSEQLRRHDNEPNKFIIDKLQVLLDHYQTRNDKWRVLSYRKAISALKNHKEPITSYKEAKKINGIGDSIASKIAEIVKTGNLKHIENIPESDSVIAKFSAVYGVLPTLIKRLHDQGLFTHDLAQPNDDLSTKYMGICRLPGGKYRRIDLFSVPYNELGAALVAYTGDDIFNRSLRLLAKKKNMKLNQHGLYENKGGTEKLIAQKTELEIFNALGVPLRKPSERNC